MSTARQVPLCFQKAADKTLDNLVRSKVIVPEDEPQDWCALGFIAPTRYIELTAQPIGEPSPVDGEAESLPKTEPVCFMGGRTKFARIGICQNPFLPLFEEIGNCQNLKFSEPEFVRIGICQNWKLSELEFVRIGICQNWNLSFFNLPCEFSRNLSYISYGYCDIYTLQRVVRR